MNIIVITFFSGIAFCAISNVNARTFQNSTNSLDQNGMEQAKPKNNLAQNVAANLCRCLPPSQVCKSTSLTSTNLKCNINETQCCENSNKEIVTLKSFENVTEAERPIHQNSGRIRIWIPSVESTFQASSIQTTTLANSKDDLMSPEMEIIKPQVKCICKTRQKCEEKYADYTFGFYCSYDKIRCCEPKEDISRHFINVANPAFNPSTSHDEKSVIDSIINNPTHCRCSSVSECDLEFGSSLAPRPADLCNADQVNCCGFINQSEGSDEKKLDNPSDPISEDQSGLGINVYGQPAFRQPIQLPFPKIPLTASNDTQTRMLFESDHLQFVSGSSGQRGGLSPPFSSSALPNNDMSTDKFKDAEVILSPPELPTHYYSNDKPSEVLPNNFYRQGEARPPIVQYYGRLGPYIQHDSAPPKPYQIIPANSRIRPSDRIGESSSNGGTWWDSVVHFFTG